VPPQHFFSWIVHQRHAECGKVLHDVRVGVVDVVVGAEGVNVQPVEVEDVVVVACRRRFRPLATQSQARSLKSTSPDNVDILAGYLP